MVVAAVGVTVGACYHVPNMAHVGNMGHVWVIFEVRCGGFWEQAG